MRDASARVELGDRARARRCARARGPRGVDDGERAGRTAELTRVRLGGEGQIRLLHVDESEREQVEREARQLTEEAERLAAAAAEAGEAARSAAAAQAATTGARRAAARDVDLLRRILAGAERLGESLAVAGGAAGRFEAPLRARVDAGASRTGELGAALRRARRRRGGAAPERGGGGAARDRDRDRADADRGRGGGRAPPARARQPPSRPRGTTAPSWPRAPSGSSSGAIQLGQVNPLAKEEYEAEKERLDELETQREDLEQSLEGAGRPARRAR